MDTITMRRNYLCGRITCACTMRVMNLTTCYKVVNFMSRIKIIIIIIIMKTRVIFKDGSMANHTVSTVHNYAWNAKCDKITQKMK